MQTLAAAPTDQAEFADFYRRAARHDLAPLWKVLGGLVTAQPTSPAVPALWAYDEVRPYLLEACKLISTEDAERRVLIFENPGLPGQSRATLSLFAGLQIILPGEIAPAHRHAASALRFIVEGDGAYTAVDGERCYMQPFDLVLTPNWQWHDHGNTSDRPMIWLDGLDIPTVRFYDASFAERLESPMQSESIPAGDNLHRYGRNMRPFRATAAERRPQQQPIFHYPYAQWRESLMAVAGADAPDPHLGHALEFINPANSGPVMPTISAHVRHLPAGFETRPRRATDGTTFVVVAGRGTARVEGREFRLEERDLFVVPSWNALELRAETPLTLFGYSDKAAQEKLSLYREERLPG